MSMPSLFSDLSLLRPWALILLGLLPILYWWLQRRSHATQNPWREQIDADLMAAVFPQLAPENKKRIKHSTVYGLVATVLAILALAGPSLSKVEVPTVAPSSETVILLGLSPSMMAQDLTPDRLTRTRIALEEWLTEHEGEDVGLAAYAGTAFRVSPLTRDKATLQHLINTIQPDVMPRPGHSLEAGLAVATQLFSQQSAHRTLLIVSDHNLDASGQSRLADLHAQGIQLQFIGVGTAGGAPIPLASGRFATQRNGQLALAEVDLQQQSRLAKAAGASWQDVRQFQAQRWGAHEQQGGLSSTNSKLRGQIPQDQGYWLLLPLLVLVALAFRRGILWLLLVFCLPFPQPTQAAEIPAWLLNQDQRSLQQWRSNPDDNTAAAVTDPRWRGVARFEQGDFAKAEKDFQIGESLSDRYNTALSQAHQDNIDAAIQGFKDILKEDPGFSDAQKNLDILERVKQQQEQQQSQNSNDESQQQNSDEDGQEGSENSSESEQSDPQQNSDGSDSASESESESQQNNSENSDQQGQNSPQQGQAEQDADSENQESAEPSASEESEAADASDANESQEQTQSASLSADPESRAEAERNLRQWLRRVDSDPARLLRERFRRLDVERERENK